MLGGLHLSSVTPPKLWLPLHNEYRAYFQCAYSISETHGPYNGGKPIKTGLLSQSPIRMLSHHDPGRVLRLWILRNVKNEPERKFDRPEGEL